MLPRTALAALLASSCAALRADPLIPWQDLKDCRRGPKVLVASIGGCGDSVFTYDMGMVRPALCPNHPADKDALAHLPYSRIPDRTKKSVKKIVYLYGNITESVLAINKRKWLNDQSQKIRTRVYKKSLNVDEYSDMIGDEFLQVEDHVMGYLTQCRHSVAFVDVTKLDEYLDELAGFLGVDLEELQEHVTPWAASRKAEERAEDQMQEKAPKGARRPKDARELAEYGLLNEEQFLNRVQEILAKEEADGAGKRATKTKWAHPKKTAWQEIRDTAKHSYEGAPRGTVQVLEDKFASVNRRLRALGPFYVHTPEHCNEEGH